MQYISSNIFSLFQPFFIQPCVLLQYYGHLEIHSDICRWYNVMVQLCTETSHTKKGLIHSRKSCLINSLDTSFTRRECTGHRVLQNSLLWTEFKFPLGNHLLMKGWNSYLVHFDHPLTSIWGGQWGCQTQILSFFWVSVTQHLSEISAAEFWETLPKDLVNEASLKKIAVSLPKHV